MLSNEALEFLLAGKKDLAQMETLKQLGSSKIKISKITNGIIDVVVGNAEKTFLSHLIKKKVSNSDFIKLYYG